MLLSKAKSHVAKEIVNVKNPDCLVIGLWDTSRAESQTEESSSSPLLRRLVRAFDATKTFDLPTYAQRLAVFSSKFSDSKHVNRLCETTVGLSLDEVQRFAEKESTSSAPPLLTTPHKYLLTASPPFIGYDSVKLQLRKAISWQFERREEMRRMGVPPTRGVLLHGPSGCGKSMVARHIAHELGIGFIFLRASDVFSKWYGESERLLREAFRDARRAAPCILFLDELEAIAPRRRGGVGSEDGDDGGTSVGARVLSTLLNELDGIDTAGAHHGGGNLEANPVIVLGATGNLEAVDEAARRPGRLGTLVLVDFPSDEDCVTMFHHYARNLPHEGEALDFSLIVERLQMLDFNKRFLTGAKIRRMCSEVALELLREDAGRRVVRVEDFVRVGMRMGVGHQ